MTTTSCPFCHARFGSACEQDCPSQRRYRVANSTLTRRTALRARTPLKATKPVPTRQSRLRPRSKKTEKLYVKRRELVKYILDTRRFCEARWDDNCQITAVDVHEILPRSQGGRIVGGDASEYLAVCRLCHDQIETNPQEAHERGFRRWSWET